MWKASSSSVAVCFLRRWVFVDGDVVEYPRATAVGKEKCLDRATWINPRFKLVMPDPAHLSEIFNALELVFYPGLFMVLQPATAPSITWFESLPTEIPKDS